MKIINTTQRSDEWRKLRQGSIGGLRFGQVISNRKNRLIYELLAERLGYYEESDYIDEDMQFGIDNEPYAADLYEQMSGIKFNEVGMIKSERSEIHHASPDRLSECGKIVLEVKTTQHPAIHIQRFFEGFDNSMLNQCINYFAVADEVEQVHLVSYCPFLEERKLFAVILKREDYADTIEVARDRIGDIEVNLKEMESKLLF